jgi:RNA polymerase sigma factor for flagellar operon FliA
MSPETSRECATARQPIPISRKRAQVSEARDENRDALILQYLPLVRHVVRQLSSSSAAGPFDREDLISYGTIGLIQAIDRFDSDRGPQFIGYATHRIRGSILDAIRSVDPLPRGVRKRSRDIDQSADELTARLGRLPTAGEIQAYSGLSETQYGDTVTMRDFRVVPLETSNDEDDRYAPVTRTSAVDDCSVADEVEKQEMLGLLADAVSGLPEREKRVITLSFSGARTLAQIGDDLGVSASRVSQLRARGIERLRNRFIALDAA